MDVQHVPLALQERLGPDATAGLLLVVGAAGREWKADVMDAVIDRFERRLVEETSGLRVQIAATEARLKDEITKSISSLEVRIERRMADLLKWSFIFWIGQVVAMSAIMSALLRA
jgi:hypothetical protein